MAKVMIVDDEEDHACLMRVLLEKQGFEVAESYNGKDAYARLLLAAAGQEGGLPDALLIDVMMSEMDGCALQSKLQEDERLKKIPVIMMTAKEHMTDLIRCLPGIFAFAEKPFEPQILISMVNAAIASKNGPV
jgi:CheY-like chemotaxis protein